MALVAVPAACQMASSTPDVFVRSAQTCSPVAVVRMLGIYLTQRGIWATPLGKRRSLLPLFRTRRVEMVPS